MKKKEIKRKTKSEAMKDIDKLKKDLFNFRFQKINGQLNNVMGIDENRFYRRQQYPEYYQLTHWALMLPTNSISKLNNQLICSDSYGYFVPKGKNIHVNIDELIDFQFAEFLLKNYQNYQDNQKPNNTTLLVLLIVCGIIW